MKQYLDVAKRILEEGILTENRTNERAMSITGVNMTFDMADGFPAITTRQFYKNKSFAEQLWFMTGKSDRASLLRFKGNSIPDINNPDETTIWDVDMHDAMMRNPLRFNGTNMGNMYGMMWRHKPTGQHITLPSMYDLRPIGVIDYALTAYEFSVYKRFARGKTPSKLQEVIDYLYNDYILKPSQDSNLGDITGITWWNTKELFEIDIYTLPGFQEMCDYIETGDYDINQIGLDFTQAGLLVSYKDDFNANMLLTRDSTCITIDGKYERRIDQLQNVIDLIKRDPTSRRMVIDSWNPRTTENSALAICHAMCQFTINQGKLNLTYYQRSCDFFHGGVYNIANYALMLHIVANITGLIPGKLHAMIGDCHIYENAIEGIKTQLERDVKPLPKLIMPDIKTLDGLNQYTAKDFKLEGYEYHPTILVKMAH